MTARKRKNTKPATKPMCRPEMAKRWANPAARIWSNTGGGMAPRWPTKRAAATPPTSPGKRSAMRWAARARRSAMAVPQPAPAPAIRVGAPIITPVAPIPAKKALR